MVGQYTWRAMQTCLEESLQLEPEEIVARIIVPVNLNIRKISDAWLLQYLQWFGVHVLRG